jgi:hypothetical protein
MNRHIFRGSRTNRDRRDQAFARSVIAEAERRRRIAESIAEGAVALPPAAQELAREALRCCTGSDPACPTHGIAASNARQDAYWRRVGGHPDAGEVDGPDVERCIWCETEPVDEAHAPYCSTYCAVQAEVS